MIRRLAPPLIAGLLLAGLCSAQPAVTLAPRPETLPASDAPPELTTALRARVEQFFQYHVDSGPALRKAIDLVAEDTKDEYFATGKMKVENFKITDVKYAPGFEKAMVLLDVTREWNFYAQPKGEMVTLPMPTYWKLEDGKWCWYKEKGMESITPMGLSNVATMGKEAELLKQNADGSVNLPADFNKPEILTQQADLILKQSSVDKDQVTLSLGAASEDTIHFINGYGEVNLEVYGVPDIPGLTFAVEKQALQPGENGVIHFRYDPAAAKAADEKTTGPIRMQPSFTARVVVEPFNQTFPVVVHLTPAEAGQ